MGCWNGTCGVSHLPIRHGDAVRTFILIPHYYHMKQYYVGKTYEEMFPFADAGPCYASDVFRPLTWPIKGEYNDYGSTEHVKIDDNAKAIVKWLNAEVKAGRVTIDKEEALQADEQPTDIERWLHLIERGTTPFGMMMVHEGIYLAAVNAYEEHLDPKYHIDDMRAEIDADIKRGQEYIQKKKADQGLGKLGKKLSLKELQALEDMNNLLSSLGPLWPKNPNATRSYSRNALECLTSSSAGGAGLESSFSSEYFQDILKKKTAPVKDLGDYIQFLGFMAVGRRMWISQPGQGSQCEEYKLHRRVAEAIIKHVENEKVAFLEQTQDETDAGEHEYALKKY